MFYRAVRGLIGLLQEYQQRRVSYWQLKNLSDKQLKDIGVSRGEIHHVIYTK
jgi:uncharacterized protein YjiS (DUF1127 family)